jgi:hypothetical protein
MDTRIFIIFVITMLISFFYGLYYSHIRKFFTYLTTYDILPKWVGTIVYVVATSCLHALLIVGWIYAGAPMLLVLLS